MEYVIAGLLLILILIQIFSARAAASKLAEEQRRAAAADAALSSALLGQLSAADERVDRRLFALAEQLKAQDERVDRRLSAVDEKLEKRLSALLESNEKKLEEMRQTVDEKLSSTLEKRLNNSFSLVSERLEAVYKGLGEMQSLAVGVGDLKRVLVNVKTRGTWGEIQLSALLEQMLAPSQYAQNVAVIPGSGARVEYAVILPGKEEGERPVYIPVDSKFPVEDYQRLVSAQEAGDAAAAAEAAAGLERALRVQAKTIHDKYIEPPFTTDFAIMFLPVEGLYAEALSRDGLAEQLQREYGVAITGPTTFSALLTALQMGFKTLAIEKRSGEVWKLLGAIKTEFGKFAGILEKTQERLSQASREVDSAARKTRTIERRLRTVSALPEEEAAAYALDEGAPEEEEA